MEQPMVLKGAGITLLHPPLHDWFRHYPVSTILSLLPWLTRESPQHGHDLAEMVRAARVSLGERATVAAA